MSLTTRWAALGLCSFMVSACAPEPDDLGSSQMALESGISRGVWVQRHLGAPTPTDHVRALYHMGLGRVLMVSARDNLGIWSWDGARWQRLSEPLTTDFKQAATYDEKRGVAVIFGGQSADSTGADVSATTWTFDGREARQITGAGGPSARGGATMSYDAAREQIVLFGGGPTGRPNDQTWLFDGTKWTQAMPAVSPPATSDASTAYDAKRQRVVLVHRGADDMPERGNGTARTGCRSRAPRRCPSSMRFQSRGTRRANAWWRSPQESSGHTTARTGQRPEPS